MAAEATSAQPPLTARDLVLTLRDLPSPPEAYYALNRLLDQPRWDLREAVAIVEREPALAARVLRVANSPYYGFGGRVADITQAVMNIGSRELRNVVLATSVVRTLSQIPSDRFSGRQFWLRALRVAVNARLLAELGPLRPLEGELFVAGLLHDIGSFLTCLKVPELARQALLYCPDGAAGALFSIERNVLRSRDAAVGRELIRQWRLPRILELAVGAHPVPAEGEEHAAAAATVQLALWASASQEQAVAVAELPAIGPAAWELTGLSPNNLAELAEPAERLFEAALKVFELSA